MATNLTDKTCAAFERAFDWAWEDDSIGWSGFAWRIWQASTAEADAKYLPVIEKLVEALEELTSIENNEELGGVWSKTHWQTAETGESVYEARLTRKEIAKFRESLALAKPLLEKKEEV